MVELMKFPSFYDTWRDVEEVWNRLYNCSQLHSYYEPVQYTEDRATLTLDLPGVKKEDLSVNVVDDLITVSGKRGKREFTRTYSFEDHNYDAASTSAILEDGVLTVSLERKPEKKSRKIEVKVR